MISIRISIALFCLSLQLYGVLCDETLSFEWAPEARSSDGIPHLLVTFDDGKKDIIELHHYNPLARISPSKGSSFMGRLKGEPDSVVAFTGIPFSSEYQISILRANNRDVMVQLDKNGKFRHVNEFNREMMKSLISPSLVNQRAFVMTKENYLRLVMTYTPLAKDEFDSLELFEEWLTKVSAHLQALYHHPSLQFKITFDKPIPTILNTKEHLLRGADREFWMSYKSSASYTMYKEGNAQHLIAYIHTHSGGKYNGYSRYCHLCTTKPSFSILKVNTNVIETAILAAVELAHSHCVSIDNPERPSKCNGLMAIPPGNSWSKCSVNYFKSYQRITTEEQGYWCLDRDDPSKRGGSWTPWALWQDCVSDCVKYRKRRCIGSSCPGEDSEIVD